MLVSVLTLVGAALTALLPYPLQRLHYQPLLKRGTRLLTPLFLKMPTRSVNTHKREPLSWDGRTIDVMDSYVKRYVSIISSGHILILDILYAPARLL